MSLNKFRKAMLMLGFAVIGFSLSCAKMNDNTKDSGSAIFINRGSALYNQQVNNGMLAYLAVDPQYTNEFNNTMRGLYSADGTQLPGGIDPVNGVTFNMMPINFNPQTFQAVINASAPPMMTIYTQASGQKYAISLSARSGSVNGQSFTLIYADDFRAIAIYGQCAGQGVQGPVTFQILKGPSAGGGEALLGYFSMPGYNNYCGFF